MTNAGSNAWRLLLATWAINSLLSPHENYLLPLRAPWVAPPCSSGVATEALGWCQVLEQLRIAMFARPTESTHRAQDKPFGRFQGGSLCLRYPGLKMT